MAAGGAKCGARVVHTNHSKTLPQLALRPVRCTVGQSHRDAPTAEHHYGYTCLQLLTTPDWVSHSIEIVPGPPLRKGPKLSRLQATTV